MIFDKGNRVIWDMMAEFVKSYDGEIWGHNGPRVVTTVALAVRPLLFPPLGVPSPSPFELPLKLEHPVRGA